MLIEQILDNSIVATPSNPDTKLLEKYTNNFNILPDLSETTFIAALHCKFNHIVNEVRRYGSSREFLTNSPNMYYNAASDDLKNKIYYKKVELESQAEFLQWWQRDYLI